MIVEDDPMVIQINKAYIERVPHFQVCYAARNGEKALQYLADHHHIDLIILDVYMPRMNGIEMLRQVRSKHTDIDVIFVTAAKEKRIIQKGLQLGAVDYLLKPFTYQRIAAALEKYYQRYLLFHESSEMDQENLDGILNSGVKKDLPKGISKPTLDRIRKAVEESDSRLDLKAISSQLNITLVTLRVYLDYLTDCGVLIKETQMGSVGRPTFIYYKL